MADYARGPCGSRVARVQAESRGNGRNYHLGWPLSVARDLALKHMGPEGLSRRCRLALRLARQELIWRSPLFIPMSRSGEG